MVADYAALLRGHAEQLLADQPGLPHEWREEGGIVVLRFPRRSQAGFDVGVEARADGVEVTAGTDSGGTHVRFDLGEYESPDALVAHVLGLVRDLLSPGMRLRVREAGGTPYRWHLESSDGRGGWRTEDTMGLLAWPFWRRRTERVLRNDTLPPRDAMHG